MQGVFKRMSQRTVIIVGTIIIAVLLATIAFLFVRYKNITKDPAATNQAVTNKIIENVGSLYITPTNEEPTVAQVKDRQKLNDQPFFEKARNGDYLLVYSKNKLAIIYREEINKLVNVGPISTDNAANAAP